MQGKFDTISKIPADLNNNSLVFFSSYIVCNSFKDLFSFWI